MSGLGNFVDQSGVTRLRASGGGGGSMPRRNVGQCRLDFNGVAGDATAIAFAFGQGDAAFIDLSAPASPKPVAAGIYAYMLKVGQDGGGGGGGFFATLVVDDDWYSASPSQGHPLPTPAVGSQLSIAASWYSDAGSPFSAYVADDSSDTYSGALYVQCLAGAALG